MKALGIDGDWKPTSPVTWGALALRIDDKIVNSVSRQKSLTREGFFQFPEPLEIPEEFKESRLIGVGLRKGGIGTKPVNGIVTKDYPSFVVHVFENRVSFENFANESVMSVWKTGVFDRAHACAAMILSPKSPYANIMNVRTSHDAKRALSLARTLLKDEDRRLFEELHDSHGR